MMITSEKKERKKEMWDPKTMKLMRHYLQACISNQQFIIINYD